MDKLLNVAIGSTCSKPGDIEGNLAQIAYFADLAHHSGSDILISPEMSASGYGGYDEVLASLETAGTGRIYHGLADIAKKTSVVITAGFAEQENENKYVSHYIVYPDGCYLTQRKYRVTKSEKPLEPCAPLIFTEEENGHVSPENECFNFFTVKGIKCVVAICADGGILNLHEILDRNAVEFLIVPVGAGGPRDRRLSDAELQTEEGQNKLKELLDTHLRLGGNALEAIQRGRGAAVVNMGGYDGKNHYHAGSGFTVSPYGEIGAIIPDLLNIDRPVPRFAFGVLSFPSIFGGDLRSRTQ